MITYSEPGDILYFYLQEEQVVVASSGFLDDFCIIDYAADGAVVGVELIGVSSSIDLDQLPESERIREMLARLGSALASLSGEERLNQNEDHANRD